MTPAERVPVTAPTPENVAESLTSSDNDYHDGYEWFPSLVSVGNVVKIGITPNDEDGEDCDEVQFRAVVAKVSEQAMFEGPLDFRHHASITGRVSLAAEPLDLTPEQAYKAAAQLIAAAALAEAGEA